MWVYIFILLLQLGELIEIKMVGTISLAGLFYFFWFVYKVIVGEWASELRSGLIAKISILYLCLFCFQSLSELIVGNELSNALKGLAVTALSYVKLMCLWPLVKKDRERITWLFVCMVISGFFNFQFMTDTEFQLDSLIEGIEYSIFKFKIAPLFGELLVVYSLLTKKRNLVPILSLIIGAMCAVLGARSTGLMIFLSGVIVFAINHMDRTITKGQVIAWSIVGTVFGYVAFVLYVTAVLNGAIVGGNSKEQFATVKNPYNPMMILLAGRSESPSSLAAISDRPLTGFGAWAKDPNFKYHKIKAEYQRVIFNESTVMTDGIPAHSVILGTGVNNGIFAMICMFLILWSFISLGTKSLYRSNRYNYIVVFCLMQLLWNGLFSPISHFRNEFPIYFCICLFAYRQCVLLKVKKHIYHRWNSPLSFQ